jgi:hypothetical protein
MTDQRGKKIVELDLCRAQTRQQFANSSRIHEDVDLTVAAPAKRPALAAQTKARSRDHDCFLKVPSPLLTRKPISPQQEPDSAQPPKNSASAPKKLFKKMIAMA